MLLEGIGPDQAIVGDVAGPGGVNALEPGLVLAPPKVASTGYIKSVFVKDRHSIKVARAFAPVAVVFVNILFGRSRIEVELPNSAESSRCMERLGIGNRRGNAFPLYPITPRPHHTILDGIKRIDDSISGGKKNQRM